MHDSPSAAASPAIPFERRASTPPGGLLIWLIVILEVFTFGVGLTAFLVMAADEPDAFAQGRASLNQTLGLVNTIVLITGGWWMANAIHALRHGARPAATRWSAAAMGAAAVFLVIKGVEYADKLAHGHTLRDGTFYTFYWLLTGFHFLHVATAFVLLALVTRGMARGAYDGGRHEDVETCGIFWHLCDLIWLLLYPVVYLLR